MSTAVMSTTHGAPAVSNTTDAAVKTRLHLTRRGRAVLTALIAVPIVIGASALAVNAGGAAASDHAAASSFAHVTISSGESLWQVAEKVAPSADPRDFVAAIVDLNQLPSVLVRPGQRLAIPTEYAH